MKWQIFIIFHKNLVDEHYSLDPSFDHQFYTFIKTNPRIKASYNQQFGYRVIHEYDLKFYDPKFQEQLYMAPSAIYHIYKNKLHQDYDFIGFLEYDVVLRSTNSIIPETITKYIDVQVQKSQRLLMPFVYQHPISRLATQKQITLNGKLAIEQIILDYNTFFKTAYEPQDIMKKDDLVTSQQSFLTDIKTFEKIMKFISWVIEQKLAERPNSWRRPSTILDRYFALALYFEDLPNPLYLKHKNLKQWRDKRDWRSFFK